MTTTAGTAPPKTQQQSPGLFGQMASTAAGVAVGSSIGHMVGGWFGGRGAEEAYPEQSQQQNYQSTDAYAQPMDQGLYNSQSQATQAQQVGGPCAAGHQEFYELHGAAAWGYECLWMVLGAVEGLSAGSEAVLASRTANKGGEEVEGLRWIVLAIVESDRRRPIGKVVV